MRTLERNEKLIYHIKRNLTDEGVEYFDPPVGLKCNPMPVTNEWSLQNKGSVDGGLLQFVISLDLLRETIIFNPYGYIHPVEGESSYGMDEYNPYGWIDEYLTRWASGAAIGDRCYVDIAPPDDYADYVQGKDADYIVRGVEKSPNYIRVFLKRLAV